jgi:signal transduction histidine kinase
MTWSVDETSRAALTARVFTLAVLLPLAALSGGEQLRATLTLVAVAVVASLLTLAARWPATSVAVAESAVVAVAVVVAYPESSTVAPYLVVPVLAAALDRGRRGVVLVLACELALLTCAWAGLEQRWSRAFAAEAALWLAAGAGIGWLTTRLARAVSSAEDDQPYRSAVALIRRLEALSGRLSGGLDAVSIAEEVMATADAQIPLRAAGVFVRGTAGATVPVRFTAGTAPGTMTWAGEMSERCWEYDALMLRDRRLALPLSVNHETVAVLVLEAVRSVDPETVRALRSELARPAVQLQAALLFGRVRESATAEERQRIAREVHDGVAQDVAGLGYLVDNLAAATHDPEQLRQVVTLREEVTRVVGELRHSVFQLRQEQAHSAGLGESLSAYANQIGTTSSMTVHVTVDEEGPRLPRDQELELMRIAQEAMANARKHAHAANLWVRCTVRAPHAEVEVLDDGTRRHQPRPDSQGLAIMRERAEAIGADLRVDVPDEEHRGTRVRVRVGDPVTRA